VIVLADNHCTAKAQKRRTWRFRGISKDAEALGVERSHLYRVLAGKRVSERLLADYRQLKEAQNPTAAPQQLETAAQS
jgi:hypothetical protein